MSELELVDSLSNLSSKILCQQQFEVHLVVNTQNFYWHVLIDNIY